MSNPTITKMRKSMVRQLRTLHESGNQQDPLKFRKRWKRKWKDALLNDIEALMEFIDGKVCYEISAAARKLKENEGLDFAFTPTTVGAFGLADKGDQEHVIGRRVKDVSTRLSEIDRLINQYGLSKVYEAFLEMEHPPERQKKLAKLDSFIRSS